MQLSLSFSALLAGVLVVVQAAPIAPPKRMVTLPIKRIEQRSDVHPKILLQQQINHASKRLAMMTGRQAPSDEMMHAAIRKRVLEVEGPEGIERRFNRHGVQKNGKRYNRTGVNKNEKRRGKHHNAGNNAAAAGTGAAAAAAGTGDAAAAAGTGNATDTGAADGTGAGADAGASSAIGGGDSATGVLVAGTPTADDSLPLDNETPDIGYLATVQIGTPPQNYLILMDSGSADFWVASEQCQSQAGGDCGNHQTLGSQSSSSFQATNTPFQVTYGTGAVSGNIIQDDVTIAGLTLPAHTFGVATEETVDFSDDSVPFDGLMGLAQSKLSEQQTPTPVESLASQGLISDAITSYKISRASDNLNDGEITFGGVDNTKFDPATLVTVPNVNTQGFWEAALDAASVNGQDLGFNGRTIILDTGTSLMVLPTADAEAVHAQITGAQSDGQGGFIVPCDTTDAVALTVGGHAFNISSQDLALQSTAQGNECQSGISAGSFGTSDTEWLVGDTFLKNAYYSTDVGQNQLSLAELV